MQNSIHVFMHPNEIAKKKYIYIYERTCKKGDGLEGSWIGGGISLLNNRMDGDCRRRRTGYFKTSEVRRTGWKVETRVQGKECEEEEEEEE